MLLKYTRSDLPKQCTQLSTMTNLELWWIKCQTSKEKHVLTIYDRFQIYALDYTKLMGMDVYVVLHQHNRKITSNFLYLNVSNIAKISLKGVKLELQWLCNPKCGWSPLFFTNGFHISSHMFKHMKVTYV